MARNPGPAAPTKPANGTANGHTNGHTKGNGHGKKTKPAGYRQLEAGQKASWRGLTIERRFTRPDVHPYDTVEWDSREALITNEHGETVFEQKDLEIPKAWSQLATQVVASKYFRGHLGTPERERSAKQMIDRVADTIADWGIKDAYFATDDDAEAFRNELKDILLKQRAAFNSPVWFNVGIDEHPQCSACFINSVDDTMESILTLAKTEGMLFKFGSGAGSNLSTIRSSKETLRGGGEASGPVSFMKGFDAFAGVIKSGGKTRRAAKMVILNADHPDVEEFIDCKLNEEKKAWALIDAGYDGNFNGGEAYASVFFQNSNNSVRVTDDFMQAVEADDDWTTHAITTGESVETVKARYLMNKMAEAAWVCGDPGIQYHDNVNRWNPVAATHTINASNPCVTGDTLVATDEGWRRIDSLVGKKANIIGADGQPHPVDRIFPTGTKPVFELKTRSGYRVNITEDHLVSTQRGDVAVKDLTPDDRIFLNSPGFGRKELSPQLAEAIGLAVGDGCLVRNESGRSEIVIITMHENEFGVLEMVAKEVNHQKEMLRAVGMPGQPGPVHVSRTATGPRVSFGSKVVVDRFKEHAVLDAGSDKKRFTDEVYGLDRASQAALLRGLFTADATINDRGTNAYVALDSTSLDLLVQVQRMLLGFGIKSHLYENRRGGKFRQLLPDGAGGMKEYAVKEMHSLRITRASRTRFEREIGFAPESPKVKALRLLNSTIGTYSDELMDDFRSVQPLGEAAVFDLTERATSHFVANCIVIHNCSEYMHIDDSACNLASLNLMKFVKDDGEFAVEDFKHAVRIVFTAQEILVSNASYPTPVIEKNSHDFRPIGIGYANLGALLMHRGNAYDSDGGRTYAAAITSIMQSESALQSARIARDQGGPFAGYAANRESYGKVMRQHRDAAYRIDRQLVPTDMLDAVLTGWDEVVALGEKSGFRNSQMSVLAPTGCLTGDSLVITDRGLVRLRSLGNPDGQKWQDLDAKVATDDGPRQATKFFVNGAEPVVTVTTSRGYRIKGTPTHRIRILDADGTWQWRRFADIRENDRVPMMLGGMVGEPREVPLPPLAEAYWTSDHLTFVPRYMNADLAELLGYFMGDGSLHSRGLRFCVTAADTDVVDRLVALGKSLFGIDAAIAAREGYTEVAFHSVRLTLWWEACGFAKRAPNGEHRGKGYESHIPDAVLYTNDPASYRAFVRGLFEADGNANHGYASWSTVSEQFSYDVQSLLLALGFVTTRKTDQPGRGHMGANPIHVLRLLNASSGARFLAEISFISERKREALVDRDHPQAARHDLVPIGRAVVDRLAPENDHLRKTMLLSLSRTGLVSRRSATALLERTADPELEQSLGYFYDTIASAELGKEQLTYDVSVPENVTYVANGFVSHNTIAFLMDCDTTGVEPDIALVKYKRLVGGGYLKIVNQGVTNALRKLGYTAKQAEEIVAYIDEHETIEGAPHLADEHLEVFDCAFKPANGTRSIHYNGHLKMMSAVQPFISGAISKTVNMPEASTPDEIAQVYIDGWKLGLKAIAVYRDNSKRSQPLNTKKDEGRGGIKTPDASTPEVQTVYKPMRRRLPDERASITHKFNVGGHEGYLTIGMYTDGTPGEIFLRMAKEGSTISGLMDSFATAVSLALQYGVPLKDLVNKFSHLRFEPAGFTGNRDIPMAKSLVDYIFRYMATRFMSQADKDQVGIVNRQLTLSEAAPVSGEAGSGPTAPRTGAAAPAPSQP
ncbi:MAG: LAGLIDADG family homing endonuclease, partial [Candidatus Limnocylindria bacterium]